MMKWAPNISSVLIGVSAKDAAPAALKLISEGEELITILDNGDVLVRGEWLKSDPQLVEALYKFDNLFPRVLRASSVVPTSGVHIAIALSAGVPALTDDAKAPVVAERAR